MSDSAAEAARPAGPGDIGTVAELYRRAIDELVGERGGRLLALGSPLSEPLETAIGELLGSPLHLVEVGTFDDVGVGFAIAHVTELLDKSSIAVLDALYVEPPARSVGVGEALLSGAQRWAVDRGCRGLDALALPGMRETKNFFEAAGFTARLLVMHQPIVAAGE